MIVPVDLYGHFRAHICTYGAPRAFFGISHKRRVKATFIEMSSYRNDAHRTCFRAVGASLTAFGVYFYFALHFSLSRSSSACFREVSVEVPLSILDISSSLSLPSISLTVTVTLLSLSFFSIFRW